MSKTVILVDDSELILDINQFALSSAGYKVRTALNGLEALDILAREPIDLAVVDINMPGMDGYTLIRKIRVDPEFGEIPVIIITTEAEGRDKKKGFDAGANMYVIKPVEPEELLNNIHLLIGEPD
jgi:two-component system chemotaxis response regulator CheY